MKQTDRIKELSQLMKTNGIKTREIKNQEEEIKIELFHTESNSIIASLSADECDTILAPIMGLAHIKQPDTEQPFVFVGSQIKKGSTLCMIEKMKVMNEIIADNDYRILEICFENGSIVEFEQVLFKVKRIDIPNVK